MHRHWRKRAFAAFLLAWFVAVATELPLLHSCPVHGSLAADAAGEQHASAHHASLHPDAGQTGDDHAACSCMGDCNTGGFSLAPASPEHRVGVASAGDAGAAVHERDVARLPAPPFLLPYANGPPRISVLA